MHKIHSDGALFTYIKNGKLQGFIASHVDDWFMAVNYTFEKDITEKLKEKFKFSKIQSDSFKYLGCKIQMKDDGSIELEQNDYIDALRSIDKFEGEDDRELLTDKETSTTRS